MPLRIRIVPRRSRRRGRTPGRLDKDVAAVAVLGQKLGLAGADGAVHGVAEGEMQLVGALFFFRPLLPLGLPFFVRGVRDAVLELAGVLVQTVGFGVRGSGHLGAGCGRVVGFVVAAVLGFDVFEADAVVEAGEVVAFVRREAV